MDVVSYLLGKKSGGGGGDLSNYLAKDNTTPYTPTGDYNPATKKYCDDKIWVGTQQQYDNLSEYSENTLYFIKES